MIVLLLGAFVCFVVVCEALQTQMRQDALWTLFNIINTIHTWMVPDNTAGKPLCEPNCDIWTGTVQISFVTFFTSVSVLSLRQWDWEWMRDQRSVGMNVNSLRSELHSLYLLTASSCTVRQCWCFNHAVLWLTEGCMTVGRVWRILTEGCRKSMTDIDWGLYDCRKSMTDIDWGLYYCRKIWQILWL